MVLVGLDFEVAQVHPLRRAMVIAGFVEGVVAVGVTASDPTPARAAADHSAVPGTVLA